MGVSVSCNLEETEFVLEATVARGLDVKLNRYRQEEEKLSLYLSI